MSPPLGLAASLGLGAPRSATSSGVVPSSDYDEDAQAYFDAIEAAVGWVEPADYTAKKTAISDYVVALKAAGNWVKVQALYLPIWQVAGPNALSMKRSEDGVAVGTTWDLTFAGTITHDGGDYIYGDGSTGYASTGFGGPASSNPKFFGIADASAGVNVLDENSDANMAAQFGWYAFFQCTVKWSVGNAYWIWLKAATNTFTYSGVTGFWMSDTIDRTGANTNAAEFFKDKVSVDTVEGTGTGANGSADAQDLTLMGRRYFNGTVYNQSKMKMNYWVFGLRMASISDFNDDTATFLAAI